MSLNLIELGLMLIYNAEKREDFLPHQSEQERFLKENSFHGSIMCYYPCLEIVI